MSKTCPFIILQAQKLLYLYTCTEQLNPSLEPVCSAWNNWKSTWIVNLQNFRHIYLKKKSFHTKKTPAYFSSKMLYLPALDLLLSSAFLLFLKQIFFYCILSYRHILLLEKCIFHCNTQILSQAVQVIEIFTDLKDVKYLFYIRRALMIRK